MFNIDKLGQTFTWKIEVKMPNNGTFEIIPVRVKYYRLPHSEKMNILEQLSQSDNPSIEQDLLDKIFAGWEKGQIKCQDGDVEDTPENRQRLLDITEFRLALMLGFSQSVGGDVGKMKG